MIENDIIQRPAKNIITVHGKYTIYQTNTNVTTPNPNSSALITLAKLNIKQSVILPDQHISIPIPKHISADVIIIEPRIDNRINHWPQPEILKVECQNINLYNRSQDPICIGKDVHLLGITPCIEINTSEIETKPHTKTNNIQHRENHVLTVNTKINTKILNHEQIDRLKKIHETHKDVFNGCLDGYNGKFGKHTVSLQWADNTRPKPTKVYKPNWSSTKDKILQDKIDQLTEMGVLADPYEHEVQIKCIHPCFIQKKGRAAHKQIEDCNLSEIRFLTAPNAVNEKCRQVQSAVPDQNEIFRFIANNPFIIYADLYESFFQNHLNKKDWGYMAINSPYKGIRVYTRSTQGLLNQDEELGQLLNKVLGPELMSGIATKVADDLLVGGKTKDDAINNWNTVLSKLNEANLKLSPNKVRIFPDETTIFGWLIKGKTFKPDPHRKLALVKVQPDDIKTIGDLRSWMGSYKTFLIAMPNVAEIMHPFDKIVAGVKDSKAQIIWTDELTKHFKLATDKMNDCDKYLALPNKDEQLIIMSDATVKNPAVGFTLNVMREDKLTPVIFYSFKLNDHQTNWWPCEREALAVATAIKKCSHYIVESSKPTLVLTDSKPVVEAAALIKKGKFSSSSRMSAFLCSISRYPIEIQHVSGKYKQNIGPDYLSRNPAECKTNNCQLCKFIADLSQCTVSDIHLQNHDEIPIGNKNAWHDLQRQDKACQEAFQKLVSGQQPSKSGPYSNDIRKYYNSCQAKDLLVVEETIPNTTQKRTRIVIPKDYVPAVIAQIHNTKNHPSVYQTEQIFNRYYFGINSKSIIQTINSQCIVCQANKTIPKSMPTYKSISNPKHPGTNFNIDIMRRQNQKIMVCRDIFSTFTTATLVKTEQRQCLSKGIIDCVSTIRANTPIIIRTDSAPGFKALKDSDELKTLQISIQPTDPSNKNSIGTVDNAIKELEAEIVKLVPHSAQINDVILKKCINNMNQKIRNRGLSAYEILFARENSTNKNLDLSDEVLLEQQIHSKNVNNKNSARNISTKPTTQQTFQQGDVVAITAEKDKNKSRDVYLVTKAQKNTVQVNKIIRYQSNNASLQSKHRIVQNDAVFKLTSKPKIPTNKHQQPNSVYNEQQRGTHKPTKWDPYKNVSYTIDFDDEIQESETNSKTIYPPDNETSSDDEDGSDKDTYETSSYNENDDDYQPENTDDYYAPLKIWETRQRTLAKTQRNLEHSHKSLNQQTDEQSDEWDYDYDIKSPNKNENPSLHNVHDIDDLFQHEVQQCESIDTTVPQNLDRVLPIPTRIFTNTKTRLTSMRKSLPFERHGARIKYIRK